MGPGSSGDYTAFRNAAAVRQFGSDRSTSRRVVDGSIRRNCKGYGTYRAGATFGIPANLVAVVQPQRFVQPLRIPPLPTEALTVPCPRHMAPDLLFHPVFNEAEALAGVSYRKVGHPTARHWIDQLNDPIHGLRLVTAEYILELPQQRRSFLELGCVLRTPRATTTATAPEVETQKAEALASTEAYDSTLLFINLDLQFAVVEIRPAFASRERRLLGVLLASVPFRLVLGPFLFRRVPLFLGPVFRLGCGGRF
jgi:hypothetical protein